MFNSFALIDVKDYLYSLLHLICWSLCIGIFFGFIIVGLYQASTTFDQLTNMQIVCNMNIS